MLNFAGFKALFARRHAADHRVPAQPKGSRPAEAGDKPGKACQSLCLGCDARTPCGLGRLIG